MKKSLLYLCALVGLMSVFTSCKDDDDKTLAQYAGTYQGEKLKLSIGEVPVTDKQVTLSGSNLMLEGVIPGEATLEIPLTMNGSTLEGVSVNDARDVNVTGVVDGNKVMTLTVNLKLKNNLVGMWDLVPYEQDDFGSLVSSPITLNAVSPDGMLTVFGSEVPTAAFESFMATTLGAYTKDLKSIHLREDGFIVATLAGEPTTTSPVGVAQYYVKDGKVYVVANLSAMMMNVRADDGGLTEIITMLTTTGMPMMFTADNGKLHVYVTKEMMAPFITLIETLLPVLGNIEGMEGVVSLLETYFPMFKGAFDKCTTFELGLQLQK